MIRIGKRYINPGLITSIHLDNEEVIVRFLSGHIEVFVGEEAVALLSVLDTNFLRNRQQNQAVTRTAPAAASGTAKLDAPAAPAAETSKSDSTVESGTGTTASGTDSAAPSA